MRLPAALLLFLPATLSTALACSRDPCAAYAQKLCNDLGAGHAECRNARRAAEDPTPEMQEVCREALRSYEDVLRVFRRPPPAPASAPATPAPSSPPEPPPEPPEP